VSGPGSFGGRCYPYLQESSSSRRILDCLTTRRARSSETSGTTHPTTLRHIPQDMWQQNRFQNINLPKGKVFLCEIAYIFYIVRLILGFWDFRCPRHVDISVSVYGKSHEIKRLFVRNLLTFKTQLLHIGTTVRVRATERHCAIGRSRARSSRWQLSRSLSVLQKIPSGR
jgi:hypothetical protein